MIHHVYSSVRTAAMFCVCVCVCVSIFSVFCSVQGAWVMMVCASRVVVSIRFPQDGRMRLSRQPLLAATRLAPSAKLHGCVHVRIGAVHMCICACALPSKFVEPTISSAFPSHRMWHPIRSHDTSCPSGVDPAAPPPLLPKRPLPLPIITGHAWRWRQRGQTRGRGRGGTSVPVNRTESTGSRSKCYGHKCVHMFNQRSRGLRLKNSTTNEHWD
mmetsp:Transcript_89451/g.149343  ORF Transcript_89451/g.149343 Transcript_89451/m.149343 type:complete len:214 (-) Transcript_89451:914-1555(-)